MAFLSPDWMAQIRAFPSQFTIPLEGNTLCKGTDGLLCSWKSIPFEPRHQVQPYAGYPHPLPASPSLLLCPLLSLSLMSTSSITLSLHWLFWGACREWVFWAMHAPINRLPSYPPPSSSFYDTLTLLAKCWLPDSSTDPRQFNVWRSGCHSLLLHSVFP